MSSEQLELFQPGTPLRHSFAKHPISLGEFRAIRDGNAELWTARDVLIDMLRDIDAGRLDIQQIVAVYRYRSNGNTLISYNIAGPLPIIGSAGMLATAQQKMLSETLL